jgi:endo-1,4-beta-xylanase
MKTIKHQLLVVVLVAVVFTFSACKHELTLKDAYKDKFSIGAAINTIQIFEKDTKSCDLLIRNFNSITAENDMKWENVHHKSGAYNFEITDKFVAFGEKHNMFIVGHCLLWHLQTPEWVFIDSLGNNVSRTVLLKRLHDHITTILTRYKGRINGYDVVNEALNDDGSMRKSKWYEIIGEDYIEKAFEFARAADPDAELYYNDYNIENPVKRTGVIRIIKNLQNKGIKITGIGIQGHWHLDVPKLADIDSGIMQISQLGIKVIISELDINVLPRPAYLSSGEISITFAMQKEMNPYRNGLPDSMQQKLANRYIDLFKIFNKYKGVINRVTLWGITDNTSWLNNWPIDGCTNYPLLFDRNYQAKPVVNELIKMGK